MADKEYTLRLQGRISQLELELSNSQHETDKMRGRIELIKNKLVPYSVNGVASVKSIVEFLDVNPPEVARVKLNSSGSCFDDIGDAVDKLGVCDGDELLFFKAPKN